MARKKRFPKDTNLVIRVTPALKQALEEDAHRRSKASGKKVSVASIILNALMSKRGELWKRADQIQREQVAGRLDLQGVKE